MPNPPTQMQAVVFDEYGGVDQLKLSTVSTPTFDADEVLLKVSYAGVGVWDAFEREGYLQELTQQVHGQPPKLPIITGSEAAGEVVAVGASVDSLKVGDRVYGVSFLYPKGGTYAQYAAIKAENLATIPTGLSEAAAATYAIDGLTALMGLRTLETQPGQTLLIFGASGGIGHLAVQLAKRMGAKVFAVASGDDGRQLCERLGADASINGRSNDITAAAKAFAPDGVDAVLLTAGGDAAAEAVSKLSVDGIVAHPEGVEPPPRPDGQPYRTFSGFPAPDRYAQLHELIEADAAAFHVEVAKTFPLANAADAHRMMAEHHLGKLVLQVE